MPDPTGRVSHLPHFHRGVAWKEPCRVATTANVTIATALNAGDTIDGITLAAGDRVLVKDQSTGSQNGIYVAGASPARAYDMDQDASSSVPASEVMGAFVYVITGTTNGGTLWRATNTSAPTLGTTSLTFVQFTSGASSVPFDHGAMGATETVDLADGDWHRGTLSANCTITVQGFTADEGAVLLFEVTQDGTGGWDITWDTDVDFGGGDDQPNQAVAGYTAFMLWSSEGDTQIYGAKVGAATALTVEDEGTPLATAADTLNFVGSGVTASGTGAEKTITISGAPTGAAGGDLSGTYPNPSVVDDSHSHTSATAPGGGAPPQILLESGHAVPFTFDDILQESDGSDFLWASE